MRFVYKIFKGKKVVKLMRENRKVALNIAIKTLLLITILVPELAPVIVNASEIVPAIQEERGISSARRNAKSDDDLNAIIVKTKDDFVKTDNDNYELIMHVQEDFILSFDYELKKLDETFININGEKYNLNESINMEVGEHILTLNESDYNNLESLKLQTAYKPNITAQYYGYKINVALDNKLIDDMDIVVDVTLPDSLEVDTEEIDDDLKVTGNSVEVNFDEEELEKEIPVKEVESDEDTSQIKYEYMYNFDEENYYKNTNSIEVENTNVVPEEQASSCTLDYSVEQWLFSGEQSKVDECTIDLSDNGYIRDEEGNVIDSSPHYGTILGGTSIYPRFIDLDQDFHINFTLNHLNDTADNGWAFSIVPVKEIGYSSQNNATAGVAGRKSSTFIATKYGTTTWNQELVTGRTDGSGTILGEYRFDPFGISLSAGYGPECSSSCVNLPNLEFDVTYDAPDAGDPTPAESNDSAMLNYTIKNVEEGHPTYGTEAIGSVNAFKTYIDSTVTDVATVPDGSHVGILEFTGAFQDSDSLTKRGEINIRVNSLTTGNSYPMFAEDVSLTKSAVTNNYIGGTLNYSADATNVSTRYGETVRITTLLTSGLGNLLNTDLFTEETGIPDYSTTLSMGQSINHNVTLHIKEIDDFLNDSTLQIPPRLRVSSNVQMEYVSSETSPFNQKSSNTFQISPNAGQVSSLSAEQNNLTLGLSTDVGGNTSIDNAIEIFNLFGITLQDAYLTEALINERGYTTQEASDTLLNSSRTQIQGLTFPISTDVEGIYNFTITYTTSRGTPLVKTFRLNIVKEDIVKPYERVSYAKNTAYGNNGTTTDSGTGIIKVEDEVPLEAFDYKVNALTHEITVHITVGQDLLNDEDEFSVVVSDEGGESVEIVETSLEVLSSDTVNSIYEYEIKTGSLENEGFARDGIYILELKSNGNNIKYVDYDGNTKTNIEIAVPKTFLYKGNKPLDASDDVLYSLIGDHINVDTDVSHVSPSDKVNPTTEAGIYGLYELESIGYEDANGIDVDSDVLTPNETDWTEDDLTLAKYDHVIRPIDGNYLVASNIEGTISNKSSDKLGGFGKDGYRPIGQKVTTTNGEDSIPFEGEITGNVDEICGASNCTDATGAVIDYLTTPIDNTYISNLTIEQSTLSNIGLVSRTKGATINNFGIVDPYVEGLINVGSFAGQISDSMLLNVYALETERDILNVNYDIVGKSRNIGGLVGNIQNSTITSDGEFTGEIPGIDLSSSVQPNKVDPDKDGYKTFNTLDVYNSSSDGNRIGGIVGSNTGNLGTVELSNLYNKGTITEETEKVDVLLGGIAGALMVGNSNIHNVYNTGELNNAGEYTGGIVGITRTRKVGESINIKNVYNVGNINAEGYGSFVGGIVGALEGNTILENAYNAGNIVINKSVSDGKGFVGGGITGSLDIKYTDDSVDPSREQQTTIKNVYNVGTLTNISTSSGSDIAGIVGRTVTSLSSPGTGVELSVENAINLGDVVNSDSTGKAEVTHIDSTYIQNTNVYSLNDTTYEVGGVAQTITFPEVSFELVTSENWWINTLGFDHENWNISAGDAEAVISNSDSLVCDESCDNDLGTIPLGYLPHVKEVKEESTDPNLEVLEQEDEIKITTKDYIVDADTDYKINAQDLSLQIKLNILNPDSEMLTGTIDIEDESGNIVAPRSITYNTGMQTITIENQRWVDGDIEAGEIQPDTTYTVGVTVLGDGTFDYESFKIHTPKQVEYNGKTYALIGDDMNLATDAEDKMLSDKIEPGSGTPLISGTKTTANYGIYELESIGYEEANGDDTDSNPDTLSTTDWSDNDLTLAKYDHIIRPLDGNYFIASNIEAIVTDEGSDSSLYKLDKDGGWSSDSDGDGSADVNDGYRPIGQIIGSTGDGVSTFPGDDSVPFKGSITGNIDMIMSTTVNNTIISNMYISEPDINNIGMISIGDDAHIEDLGIVDPKIVGSSYVGGYAGQMIDSDTTVGEGSMVVNAYTLESRDDSTSIEYDIIGEFDIGGLIGRAVNTTINSTETFTGTIEGTFPEYLVDQPSKIYPDKDGYKTFNTLDIKSTVGTLGGVVGKIEHSNVDSIYNKGSIKQENGKNVGGILGYATFVNIYNSYNTGNIVAYEDDYNTGYYGVWAGGIIGYLNNTTIMNCYNTGNITGEDSGIVGGIVGLAYTSGNKIKNVYNTGEIKASFLVGGVVGSFANLELEDAYNLGEVTLEKQIRRGDDGLGIANKPAIGGVVGAEWSTDEGSTFKDTYNAGDLIILEDGTNTQESKVRYGHISGAQYATEATYTNNYAVDTMTIDDVGGIGELNLIEGDSTAFKTVNVEMLKNSTWWKDTLGLDDSWNIEVGDASVPLDDKDPTDESFDDASGTIPQGYYPTLKQTDGTNPLSTKYEVSEQIPELVGIPTSVGTQIIKENNVVYPVLTSSISGLTSATEEELAAYKETDLNSDGIVKYDELTDAQKEYVLNPDEFVKTDSTLSTDTKYVNNTVPFNFISTGVEWDYDNTNNADYNDTSVERNPNILVDDITLKTSISLPSTYEITGVDIRKINSSGIVEADIGNMIGYFTAPNSSGGMDIYVRIRPDYYFSDMDQYIVKSISYDKLKDNDLDGSDDKTITLWNDLDGSGTINGTETYIDIYSVDGYGNVINNDLDGNGVIDGTESSDGIPDNQTDDTRGLYKGVYTCKNTDSNMDDYTIENDNIYSKLQNEYKNYVMDTRYEEDVLGDGENDGIQWDSSGNIIAEGNPAYNLMSLSGLDTMYYYGFSFNDIRYYNNGSSFAFQRDIDCLDADRDGNSISLDATNRAITTTDRDDIMQQLIPSNTAGSGIEGTEYVNDQSGYDLDNDGTLEMVNAPYGSHNSFIGAINGQGHILENVNLATQISGYSSTYSRYYGYRALFLGGNSTSKIPDYEDIILKDLTYVNDYYFSPYNEPLKDITAKTEGDVEVEGNIADFNGSFLSKGTANLNNVIIDGFNIYIDVDSLYQLDSRLSIVSTDNSAAYKDIMVKNINIESSISNKVNLAAFENIFSLDIENFMFVNNNFTGNFNNSMFVGVNWRATNPKFKNVILDYNYNDYEANNLINGSTGIIKSYEPLIPFEEFNTSGVEIPAAEAITDPVTHPVTVTSDQVWYNDNMGYSTGVGTPLRAINDIPGNNIPTPTVQSYDETIRSEIAKTYSDLNSPTSYGSDWINWNTDDKIDGYYPELKTSWGMLMEQESVPISDTLSSDERSKVNKVEDNIEDQKEDENTTNSVDVGQIQKDSEQKSSIDLSSDEQDEMVLPEEEEANTDIESTTNDNSTNEEVLNNDLTNDTTSIDSTNILNLNNL